MNVIKQYIEEGVSDKIGSALLIGTLSYTAIQKLRDLYSKYVSKFKICNRMENEDASAKCKIEILEKMVDVKKKLKKDEQVEHLKNKIEHLKHTIYSKQDPCRRDRSKPGSSKGLPNELCRMHHITWLIKENMDEMRNCGKDIKCKQKHEHNIQELKKHYKHFEDQYKVWSTGLGHTKDGFTNNRWDAALKKHDNYENKHGEDTGNAYWQKHSVDESRKESYYS